jgi:hypothetical protein
MMYPSHRMASRPAALRSRFATPFLSNTQVAMNAFYPQNGAESRRFYAFNCGSKHDVNQNFTLAPTSKTASTVLEFL